MLIELLYLGATFVLSLALSLYLTPIIKRGAEHFGVLDYPDGHLKRHAKPIPYLGGIAVYLSFLITIGLTFEFKAHLLGLLLGGTMIAMLGLFDDFRVLPAAIKLAGQGLIVWIIFKSGIYIQLVAIPVWVAIPLTIAWLIGITNAVNIIDVSDGVACGVSAIAGIGLFIIATLNGDKLIATTTLALVGSLIGFLRYNQAPAQIYLGDTGSMFIGFMLAALSMIGAYTQKNMIGVGAPILILIVPIMDLVLVCLARIFNGQSPFRGSPDHIAIRLITLGWTSRRVAAYSCFLGLVGTISGVAIVIVDTYTATTILIISAIFFFANFIWLWRIKINNISPIKWSRKEL